MTASSKLNWTNSLAALSLAMLVACGGGPGGNSGGGNTGGDNGVPPSFTAQPASVTVNEGQSATFTVAATGTPTPTDQWERSTNGSTWSTVSSATSATYTFSAAKTDHSTQYRARASNASGSATSSPATLTVYWAPAITTQPTNQTVNSPTPAIFTMDMDCNPDASSQWQSSANGISWQDIPGATGRAYNTGPTSPVMNNLQYQCMCTNSIGSTTSNAAVLSVDIPTYALTVNLGTGASGTPATGSSYAPGSVVSYAYTALAGYSNLQVLLDGGVVASSGTVTMNSAHTLAASATPIQRTVTFVAGSGGAVTGTPIQTIPNGGSTTAVTAVPNGGYSFVNWTGAGFATSTANPLVLSNVLLDLTLTANFTSTAATYTIAASAGIYGRISPSGAVSVPAGGSMMFSITADAYYSVADVVVDGVSVGAVDSYTFNNVTSNHTITATFAY